MASQVLGLMLFAHLARFRSQSRAHLFISAVLLITFLSLLYFCLNVKRKNLKFFLCGHALHYSEL